MAAAMPLCGYRVDKVVGSGLKLMVRRVYMPAPSLRRWTTDSFVGYQDSSSAL